jgi:hypothetical protein
MKKTAVLLLAMGITLYTAGCGSQGSPAFLKNLVPATGHVTVKGKPLAGATVMFFPASGGSGGQAAMAITDEKGNYQLSTLASGVAPEKSKGALPGEYTVTISRIAMPDGSPLPGGITEENEAIAKGAKQHVPQQYLDPSTSPLKAKIAAPKAENNFEL